MEPVEIVRYYLNDEVANKIVGHLDREVVAKYGESFGKRPNNFINKEELERAVRSGATSFHFSEERWKDFRKLSTSLTKEQLNELRIGWDLVIDIDSKNWEISKEFAKMIINKVESEGVKNYSIKFSGGSGFHILVPFEAFPPKVGGKETKDMFPQIPMIISNYLKLVLKEELKDKLKEFGFTGEDPFEVVDIDSVLITERHLVRMQYSLNEKKWLVSIPLDKSKLDKFIPEDATPGSIDTKLDFFDVKPNKNEASILLNNAYGIAENNLNEILLKLDLLNIKDDLIRLGIYSLEELAAFDQESIINALGEEVSKNKIAKLFESIPKDNKPRILKVEKIIPRKINPALFPPCIKNILNGVSDGRKRSLFILINFFRSLGMSEVEVEKLIKEWNQKNKPPLKEGYINSQINYMKKGKVYVIPNCDSPGYYKYFGVCTPDETCKLIKNPLSYYNKKLKENKESK